MQRTGFSVRLLLATLSILVLTAAARAESLTFQIRSNHENVVSLEFYSQDRNAAWPGNGKVYILDDYDVNSYALSCRAGEDICYGAWVRNDSSTYWGVGYNNEQYCESCCWTCDGGTTSVINLNY